MSELAQKWLSRVEFGRMFRIGLKKVDAMIKSGALCAIDTGAIIGRSQVRISPTSLEEFVAQAAVKPPAPRRKSQIDDGISASVRALLDDD